LQRPQECRAPGLFGTERIVASTSRNFTDRAGSGSGAAPVQACGPRSPGPREGNTRRIAAGRTRPVEPSADKIFVESSRRTPPRGGTARRYHRTSVRGSDGTNVNQPRASARSGHERVALTCDLGGSQSETRSDGRGQVVVIAENPPFV